MTPHRRPLGLTWVACLLAAAATATARAEVTLRLQVPPAETYVLGDAIPLGWEFHNRGTVPLGFMWEGCCRINGQLKVTSTVGEVNMVPTSTALAHTFAKADRLDPGVPKAYDTKISDWVELPGTGTFRLTGVYRGVLPVQFPQVARGLALWRDAAESPPIEVAVLGVDDYLRERDARIQRRAVRLTLTGPDRLPPVGTSEFEVRFENLGSVDQTIAWPDDEALWVVDARGRRVAPAAVIGGATESLVLPAGGTVSHRFTVASDRFETEPFGDYRVFVDLAAAGPNRPRVPSNVLPLVWRVDPAALREVVEAAAAGAGTGARNAPLKLLRVYLSDLGPRLATVPPGEWTEPARALVERLVLASRLKPIAPKPGTVPLWIQTDGQRLQWNDPALAEVLKGTGPGVVEQLAQVVEVRRHLGWELAVGLLPEAGVAAAQLSALAQPLQTVGDGAVSRPDLVIPTGGTNAPITVIVNTQAGAAPAVPTLRIAGAAVQWSTNGVQFEPWDGRTPVVPPTPTGGPAVALPGRAVLPPRMPQIVADGEVPWDRLQTILKEALPAGSRVTLRVVSPGGV